MRTSTLIFAAAVSFAASATSQVQLNEFGYYPDSDFVHIDTGTVRSWGPKAA